MTTRTLIAIAVAVVGLVSIAFLVIFELRKTPKQGAEMIERENDPMSELPDDSRKLGRWVP